jgi:hypothetical protein
VSWTSLLILIDQSLAPGSSTLASPQDIPAPSSLKPLPSTLSDNQALLPQTQASPPLPDLQSQQAQSSVSSVELQPHPPAPGRSQGIAWQDSQGEAAGSQREAAEGSQATQQLPPPPSPHTYSQQPVQPGQGGSYRGPYGGPYWEGQGGPQAWPYGGLHPGPSPQAVQSAPPQRMQELYAPNRQGQQIPQAAYG